MNFDKCAPIDRSSWNHLIHTECLIIILRHWIKNMPRPSPQQNNRGQLVFHLQQHRKRYGYFTFIKNNYGVRPVYFLKSWLNIVFSIAIVKNQLKFLTECRKFDLIPKHISTLKMSHLSFRSNYVKKKIWQLYFNKTKTLFELGD